MPDTLLPTALAFFLGGAIAYWELITSKYARTLFLACRCVHVYIYALIYATAAAVVMVVYEALVPHTGPHSYLGGNLWIRAVAVGLFTKSFLHFRVFTVPGHPEPTPIGLETIMLMFIPYLLREIELGHDRREMEFVRDRVYCLPFQAVSEVIGSHLPENMPQRDRQGFLASIKKSKSSIRAARLYLRLAGRGHFDLAFPAGICTPRSQGSTLPLSGTTRDPESHSHLDC